MKLLRWFVFLAGLFLLCPVAKAQPTYLPSNGIATWCWTGSAWVGCSVAGGGGGGAVTIANGADVALGSTTDAACAAPATSAACTLIAAAKAIVNAATSPIPAGTNAIGSVSITSGTVHDCGGAITTGGTAQQAISSAQFIHGFLIEVGVNDSNTDAIYFSDTTVTPGVGVAGSLSLNASTSTAAGGSFSTPLNYPAGSAIYVNGATTGDKFKCRYW